MSDCERFEPTLEAYVAGELPEAAIGPLLAHCRACEACRRLLELHRDLSRLAADAPGPDEADLEILRERVVRGIAAAGPAAVVGRAGPAHTVPWGIGSGRIPWIAIALAASVLLFVAGLAAGRAPWGNPEAALRNRLVAAIRSDAASNHELQDVEDSPFTYSNVSLRRAKGERVALDFDVTTHVQLGEPVKSAVVQDVLAQALLDPSSAGARLRAMELSAENLEPKLKEALLLAMRNDQSLAVRLEALSILSPRLTDPDVQTAVLATLRDDESVQMRLLALDALAAHSVDRRRLREAIREKERPGDEALMVRLAQFDKKL